MERKAKETIKLHQSNTNIYVLEKIVGSGAYGTVFKAKCCRDGKKVAIKFVNIDSENDELLKLICRELKINISLSLNKNNIFTPQLLDVYFPTGTDIKNPRSLKGIYFVFEYFGKNLNDLLKCSRLTLTKTQMKVVLYNLLCATKFIHDSNIIHRDLKP